MVHRPDDDAPPPPRARSESRPDPLEEEPKSRTGRFHVQHRGGTRVEVGEPIRVGGERPWMCAVKLVGRKRDEPRSHEDPEPDADAARANGPRRDGGGCAPRRARAADARLRQPGGAAAVPHHLAEAERPAASRPAARGRGRTAAKLAGRLLDRLRKD